MSLFDEIKEMIVFELMVDADDVTPEAHLTDDLDADSLALVRLAQAIEKRYGVSILGDDLDETPSVGNLVALVETKRSA